MVAFEQEEKGGLSKEAWKHESLMDTEILVVGKRLVLFLRECSPQGCFLQKLKRLLYFFVEPGIQETFSFSPQGLVPFSFPTRFCSTHLPLPPFLMLYIQRFRV